MRTFQTFLLVLNAVFMTLHASAGNAWIAVGCAIGMAVQAKDLMDGPHA